MKSLIGLFLVFATLLGANQAHAIFPQDTKNQALLSVANARDPLPGIGNIINWTKNLLRCTYSFATLGGATGAVNLLDDQGSSCLLPKGAILTHTWLNVTTAVTGGTNATISASSGVGASDILAITNNNVAVTYGSTGFYDGKPAYNGAVSTYVGPTTTLGGTQVTMTIGTATLTAGVIQFFMEYVIQ